MPVATPEVVAMLTSGLTASIGLEQVHSFHNHSLVKRKVIVNYQEVVLPFVFRPITHDVILQFFELSLPITICNVVMSQEFS